MNFALRVYVSAMVTILTAAVGTVAYVTFLWMAAAQ